jgi:hypothetical protein
MKCKDCAEGKRHTRNGHGCVQCILYGMILLEDHECTRKGAKRRERDEDQRDEGEDETEIQRDGCGAA